jgi:hypothetical protein
MICTNLLAVVMFFRVNTTTKIVTENWLPSVRYAGNMLAQVNYYRSQEFRHILSHTNADMDSVESNMRRSLSQFRASAELYRPLVVSPGEDLKYKRCLSIFDDYYAISQTVLRYSRQNINDTAQMLMLGPSLKQYLVLRAALIDLNDVNTEGSQMASRDIDEMISSARIFIIGVVVLGIVFMVIGGIRFATMLETSVNTVGSVARSVAQGDISSVIKDASLITGKDEFSALANAMNVMILALQKSNHEKHLQQWMTEGQYGLGHIMNGDKEIETLSTDIITYLCNYVQAQMGVLYILNEDKTRVIVAGTYCCPRHTDMRMEFAMNEGIAGQVCYERKMIRLDNIPAGYGLLYSAVGTSHPNNVLALPCVFRDTMYGVIEVISFEPMNDEKTKFLQGVTESIAVAINAGITRTNIARLLEETNRRAEELSVSYEEITRQQEVLTQQTRDIELANSELLERNSLIEQQQKEMKYAIQQAELYMQTVFHNPQLIALADFKTLQFRFINDAGRQYLDIPESVQVNGLDKTVFWNIDSASEKEELRNEIRQALADKGVFSVATDRKTWGGNSVLPTHVNLYVVERDEHGMPTTFAELMTPLLKNSNE